ncbi:cysteine ABC transporter substrate-binding protein [Viridibacillus sp. YIM B01967]|uniref:Cysteine ABC transporter substrate-binding protein n=1 Tax=Viridibacillus soli TaxID=2798301 RepID=A0ABS1HC42_9BACL|nr:cysteine ABC transporter substrate-binding protein [Viridibacillus soli]MBK3496662.1 cysteine ABC transporter substrate-binding protein [Viridibacillus soli]
MTKKFFKNVFALITLSILVLALTACGNDNSSEDKGKTSSIDAIKERGKVRIAVFSDKPPFGYIDENGKNQGYDILLAKRIAKDLLGDESKVEFILTEAQNRVDVLKSDKVDITLANFTVTPERSEQVDFANPYMKVAIGVASPKKAAISDIQQLDGKKLLINKGTTAETYFAKNYADIEQVKYDQNTETFEALKDGRGAALAHDNTLLYAWVKENPDYVVDIKSIGDLDYIAPAVKKGNKELLDWLNEELETLGKEQFFHKAFDEVLRPVYGENVQADDVVVEGKSK